MGSRAYKKGVTDKFYPTAADLLRELAGIIQKELKALVQEGVPYIQMDAPGYTPYVDATQRERMRASGIDPDQAFEEFSRPITLPCKG